MIYYITKNVAKLPELATEGIVLLSDFTLMYSVLASEKMLGLDKEFNGLNELNTIPLLTVVGTEHHQFVIDDCSFPTLEYLLPFKNRTFIGHNIKIDIKVARLQGIDIRNVYDVMIAEQRFGLGTSRSNSLEATHMRRLGIPMKESKSIRDSFTIMSNTMNIKPHQIKYAAGDISCLFAIREVQLKYIEMFNYNHLLYNVEFPLIPIIADGELEGIELNEDKWIDNINYNRAKILEIEPQLDEQVIKLGGYGGGKPRRTQTITQSSLFPDLIEGKEISNKSVKHINYRSSTQIFKRVFAPLDLPIPQLEKRETNKRTGVKEKNLKNSLEEASILKYLLDHPLTPVKEFLNLLLKHKSHSKSISSFGYRFIRYKIKASNGEWKEGYKNEKTGRIHTIYRQCMAETGRFQSGDSNIGFYNSQQIPTELNDDKVPIYRVPFQLSQKEIDNDWWMVTADLTGAEAVIMCAFAKDPQLLKWAIEEDDLHSPMATRCWRAVAERRNRLGQSLTIRDSVGKEHEISEDILINKHTNKQLRTDFKRITFGVIYGARDKTVGKTLNITNVEGQLMIDIFRELLPETFRMVEAASAFAIQNGYIIHNTRTNSRRYFEKVFKSRSPSFIEKADAESKARNSRIQGTQADILKEAMVNIDKYYKENNISNCFLLQVHDELVWKVKGKENCSHIGRIMSETANLYLEGFTTMKTEWEALHHWTK